MKMLRRWHRAKTIHENQEGLVLLFWALSFLFMMAFLAIVVETGFVLLERRDLQNTADAAALAGAQQLAFGNYTGAVADAEAWADKNAASQGRALNASSTYVAGPNADPALGDTITVTVRRNAPTVFNGFLSFGEPEVSATASARLATTRLPGVGATCLGVEATTYEAAQLLGNPAGPLPDVAVSWAALDPTYITVLRLGSDANTSNVGFISISGDVNQNTEKCLRNGSANALQPTVDSKPGVKTGQARKGLQQRLEAAMLRSCYSWDDIVQSIQDAADDADGIWRCNPLTNQETAVISMPVIDADLVGGSGTQTDLPLLEINDDTSYVLSMVWVDGERTFEDTSVNKWKFLVSGGQGQAEIYGVFLMEHPTTLVIPPSSGQGGIVACTVGQDSNCFLQLVQ